MPDQATDFAAIVPHFLPFDPDLPEGVLDELPEADFISAMVACFALAARRQLPKMNETQRHDLCRDLAGRLETKAQIWMVEACLRAAETDGADYLVGIPGDVIGEVQLEALIVLGNDYLTKEECEALYAPAAEQAQKLQPLISAAREQAAREKDGS
ncbi:hypothetical protein LWF15_20095 [Kineosporia rhizophila]|uniref:hypothetical protein n=1 Tax=Kineosporia TaxID=49184 RepID=UPI000A98BF83|nr:MULTISPECIES: hypothetical protein [Kineosporia]MCE0537799.1 hypothetical protein [Kineosporia rhizophila]GLY15787.1 hypothetical protein Kisp01_28020 [Kineosporia sp. NBRC 101677]